MAGQRESESPRFEQGWWLLLPRQVRQLPADIAATIVLVVLTDLVALLPVVSQTPLRVIFGLPFVLFVPGYAFVAALFPEGGESADISEDFDEGQSSEHGASFGDGGIDGIERTALSFGLSIAIVPLIGLVLNFTPWGIRLLPVLMSVSAFTLITAVVAARRRRALPEAERFRVPYRDWIDMARTEFFEPDGRTDAILNVLLVLSILLAVSSVAYAVAVPKQGESFTEFYLLTEDEDGDLIAAEYPTEFERGASKSLIVGIRNHEHTSVEYTVVTEIQRVRVANNSTTVLESQELRRFRTTLDHNETWHRKHNVTPSLIGDRLRLTYLLYRGDPPSDPTTENAYRELHLWVTSSDG